MKKIRTQVDAFVGKLLVLILGVMVINVLWQVFSRYFTDSPSSFTDELARYLMIWLGILGAAYVGGRNEHVAIDFFTKKSSPKVQKWLKRFITFSISAFAFFWFCCWGWTLGLYHNEITTIFAFTPYSTCFGIFYCSIKWRIDCFL